MYSKVSRRQYIIFLACGLVTLLLLFAILFIAGVSSYVCLSIIQPIGLALFATVQHLSKKFGEFGLMKRTAQRKLPRFNRGQGKYSFN
ncbi:DUF4133 domain-containing protein [Longitalea arenae]|uniref:DUF4133 domain-containing protein n=1 Tax=Longitalea arenae TaxID=2812558 RepID=UPI001F07C386|nr:DUF4133 domain-containing protein [Longitalea arenae]